MAVIADALKVNRTITKIVLTTNNIGDKGAAEIAELLKINNRLQEIYLYHNNISGEGVVKIVEALIPTTSNPTIYGLEFKKHIELFSLPNEFSRASNKEILAYLRELHSSPPTKRFRMRLMIVGPGEAGKTTLVQRLLDNTFSPNQFSMTDGVSMKEWNPTAGMNLTLWDFGGQQVYLNTHTMFFADKSLYLVVWNPRTRTDLRVLEEYILNIRSRTKVGHIIFVTTHGAEVQDRESKQWLKALSKYNYLSYHNVDSYSGLGIAELKQTIINFVTEDQAAQELIPAWYLELEAHLKELSKSEFSIDRERFLSICFLFWKPFNQAQSLTILDPRFLEVANAVLSLFHQWGVIFLLKKLSTQSSIENDFSQCGDIVLDPQRLAHVFKCVISASSAVSGPGSSSASAASPSELLSQGFLSHDQIGSIWEGYDPRLHSQFLRLLQDSELCYEQFDLSGASTNCSLVPSLLPVDIELEFSAAKNTSPIVNQGFVRISFDCLLPNFFPRLMVRLRDVSSPSAISRHHFIVSLHEGDLDQRMVKSSFVRVVEDHDSKSLLLYPEGVSFGATRLCCEAIRELMNESFSGMCTKEISFTTEDTSYLKKKLLSCFQSNSSPTLTLENGMVIPLTFLSPLLKESHDSKEIFSQFPSESLFIRSVLQNRLNQFQESKDVMDRFTLGRALMKAIPICREHGLGLERSPIVLWLVGRCDLPPSTPTSSSSSEYFLCAVSPNVNPSLPWMFILDSVIHLSAPPHCDEEANSHWDLDFQCLVIECLNHLIPSITWPSNVTHWSLFLPHAMEKEELFKLILEKEKNLFDSHIDFFGIEFLLWKPLLMEQRNPVALMKRVEEMMEVLRSNQEELKSSQQVIVSQLNRVEASVTHLSDQLTNVFLDIQEEFRRWNEEGLREIREVWGTRVDNLERLLLKSTKDDLEVLIKRELKGLELQLDEKLTDMESMNAERLMIEFRSLSNELMSASLGRQQGDETSAQKLDQMLLQMRVIQNQMDRVEEKMTQFVANFADCLSVVKGELLANGHSNGLKELREFWMEKMSDLENLIHQKNAHPNSSNGSLSEETIEKLVRKIDKKLKVRFHHFDLSVSEMTPQLMDMKAQLLGLVTGINAGDLKSEKRFESVMGELKELQTQLVESIHLQEELSQNLNQGLSTLKNCVVNINTRTCPTTFILVPTSPLNSEGVPEGLMDRICGLYKAIRDLKGTVVSLLQDKFRIALICEACGCPSEEKDSWYEVREPLEIVGKILPLVRAGLQFASVVNKGLSLGRIFGLPIPVLQNSSFDAGREFLSDLTKGDLFEYAELQRLAQEAREGGSLNKVPLSGAQQEVLSMGGMGYCIREFSNFLTRVDSQKRWSDLSPRVNENGDLCFVCPKCCGLKAPLRMHSCASDSGDGGEGRGSGEGSV